MRPENLPYCILEKTQATENAQKQEASTQPVRRPVPKPLSRFDGLKGS